MRILPSNSRSKNGELFATKCADLATYVLYKYLRQMADEKLNEVFYQSDYLWMGVKTTT